MKLDIAAIMAVHNNNRLVKIRYTRTSAGKIWLYLEHNYRHNQVKKRDKLSLNISLSLEEADRRRDNQFIRHAVLIRDAKETEIMEGGTLRTPLRQLAFNLFAEGAIAEKKMADRSIYAAAVNRFNAAFPALSLSDISPQHAKTYLSSISHLKARTINHYIKAIRHICKKAVQEGLLTSNPFEEIKSKKVQSDSQFLTRTELLALTNTVCGNLEVERAFLFSCYTGLRLGDIKKLRSSNIQEGYLVFTQSKTGSHERIKIPQYALGIVADVPGLPFQLPTYKHLRKHLKRWVELAGITKHITFHCARHTFATLQIELGVDVYLVSNILGHSDVKVTQIYAKIVDKKKDEAMDLMDTLFD